MSCSAVCASGDDRAAGLRVRLQTISTTSDLANAIRDAVKRMWLPDISLAHGRPAVDSNTTDPAIIGLATGRRIWLFAGSGGRGPPPTPWSGSIYMALDIADHPINRITDLLPCRFVPSQRSAILGA